MLLTCAYSYQEFLEQTQKNDFNTDEGWQGLDEQQAYSDQEFEEYQRQRRAELEAAGVSPLVSI